MNLPTDNKRKRIYPATEKDYQILVSCSKGELTFHTRREGYPPNENQEGRCIAPHNILNKTITGNPFNHHKF